MTTTSTPTTTTTTVTSSASSSTVTWTNDTLRDAILGISGGTRLPPFWTQNPEAWFIQVEAHFALSRITSDNSKYTHVVAALPPDILARNLDCLKTAQQSTDKYTTLVELLVKRLGPTEDKRMGDLLYNEQMGDQTPSEFYRRLSSLVGNSKNEETLLMKIFTDRLPSPLDSTVIQLKAQGPEVFLPVIDSIWEKTKSQKPSISAVGSDRVQNLEIQLAAIQKTLSELKASHKPHHRGRSKSRNGRKPRRSQTPSGTDNMCYYHKKFGKEARKCAPSCKFWKGNSNNQENQ